MLLCPSLSPLTPLCSVPCPTVRFRESQKYCSTSSSPSSPAPGPAQRKRSGRRRRKSVPPAPGPPPALLSAWVSFPVFLGESLL